MEPVRFGLVGVGGYGKAYLRSLNIIEKEGLGKLTSVAIRSPKKYPEEIKTLTERGITIRSSLEEMLEKDRESLEIVAIPTGIVSHRDQMIQTVEAGLDVVLEKPSTATIQDLDAMLAALERTGRFCQIGFQNQGDPAAHTLQDWLCEGRIGALKTIVIKGCWRRGNRYFERNSWAGVLKLGDEYVLDGTINNPLAHYLFNGLYFASSKPRDVALPVSVRAELYRGHAIESEDTSCLEIECENGVKVYFYSTLCGREDMGPVTIEIEGEKGKAYWDSGRTLRLYDENGLVEEKAHTDDRFHADVHGNAARYLRKLDSTLNCPLAMTRAHVLAVNGAFQSAGIPVTVPLDHMEVLSEKDSTDAFPYIRGVEDLLAKAAGEKKLFSDLNVPWAVKTKPVSMKNYTHFEMPSES